MAVERDQQRITREIGELSIRVDTLVERMQWQSHDKTEFNRRLGTLEARMAQVTIVAALAAVVLPVVLSLTFR